MKKETYIRPEVTAIELDLLDVIAYSNRFNQDDGTQEIPEEERDEVEFE